MKLTKLSYFFGTLAFAAIMSSCNLNTEATHDHDHDHDHPHGECPHAKAEEAKSDTIKKCCAHDKAKSDTLAEEVDTNSVVVEEIIEEVIEDVAAE